MTSATPKTASVYRRIVSGNASDSFSIALYIVLLAVALIYRKRKTKTPLVQADVFGLIIFSGIATGGLYFAGMGFLFVLTGSIPEDAIVDVSLLTFVGALATGYATIWAYVREVVAKKKH